VGRWSQVICKWCGKEFDIETKFLVYANKENSKCKTKGQFCSVSCGSKHSASLRPLANSKKRLNGIARMIYIERNGTPACFHCGKVPADVHHLNEDTTDNSKENLLALCRSCHVAYHNSASPKRKRAVNE
jgi:5-methylcytosine-specific restriction endonuclease McrA